MNATIPILYMVVALFSVYPLQRAIHRTGVSSREAPIAAFVLSTMWVAIVLYGGIAWCASPEVRKAVTYPWQRRNIRARAAAIKSSQRSSISSGEPASSVQSAD